MKGEEERGRKGRDGQRESGARTAGDLDTLERFVAPGGTERAIVISRGGAWKTIAPAFPDIKDAESRLNRLFQLIHTPS